MRQESRTSSKTKKTAKKANGGGGGATRKKPTRQRVVKTETGRALPVPSRSGDVDETDAASQTRGKYVYCVIRSAGSLKFGAIGLGSDPSEVNTINYRDLAAVVSETPIGVHDPTRDN